MKHLKSIIIGIVLVAMLSPTLFAQSFRIIPFAGLSKDMRSGTNMWNMGFTLGAQGFAAVSPDFWIGGRIALHSWGSDGQGWFEDLYGSPYVFSSASGSQTVFEIMPSIRYLFTHSEGGVNVAGQAGLGLIFVGGSDVTVNVSWHTTYSSGTGAMTLSSEGMMGFGLQLGVPVTVAKIVEIMPIYTLYLAGGDLYHHIALNVGVRLGKQ